MVTFCSSSAVRTWWQVLEQSSYIHVLGEEKHLFVKIIVAQFLLLTDDWLPINTEALSFE